MINDSNSFEEPEGHANPSEMKYRTQEWTAGTVNFGQFRLSDSLVSRMNDYQPLKVGEEELNKAENLGFNSIVNGDGFYLSENVPPEPGNPSIGDIRVSCQGLGGLPVFFSSAARSSCHSDRSSTLSTPTHSLIM